MKKNTLLLQLFAALSLFSACGENNDSQTTATSPDTTVQAAIPDMAHNSANSLDWNGTYTGTLPCADCEGILTTITLNPDKTFVIITTYKGKSDKAIEEKGSFTWNEAGNTITITRLQDRPTQYQVGENKLTQLDMSGNKITGSLADKYVLVKQTAVAATTAGGTAVALSLEETHWKLTEITGNPVEAPKDGQQEIFITLVKQDTRIRGFGGCNNFNGKYELKEGNRLSFSGIAATLKACTDMKTEDALMKALEQTDNYSINGNILSLNKLRMAPLARFEAVANPTK